MIGLTGILLNPASLLAQATATVEGAVRAQDGRPLEGVEVTFEPGEVRAATDPEGRFTLAVPAGRAGILRFSRSGFESEEREISPIPAGEDRSVAVTLPGLYRIDALTVTTRRERPLLNTTDATTGGAIDRDDLVGLPTDARDPLGLAFTIPGVSQGTGFFGDAPPLSINGANTLYTQYLIDGLDNNEGFLGGPRVELPLSALERLSVFANSYRPALGRSSNGVVDYETRSGGRQWSTELFTTWRPGVPLDARPKFAPDEPGPGEVDPEGFRRFQLGGSVGGPLVEDRTFFFATLEFTDEREDRIGSTARTDFLGTEIRERWKAFARLDHGWSPTQTSTLRFALSDVSREGQGGGIVLPEADITTRRRGTITNLTHRTSVAAGRGSNELSVQLGTFRWYFPPSKSDLETPQVRVFQPGASEPDAVVGSSNFIFDESELQLQLKEVFERRLGNGHTLRLGADVLRSSFELTGSSTNPNGVYDVLDEGNIQSSGRFLSIRDIPADVMVLRYTIDANPQQVDLTQTLWGAFAEDIWRVGPALTVQAGLRWDYDDITLRGESDPDLDNVQPRLSLNWFATPSSVVRAGWGLYAGKFPYAVYSDAVQFGPDGNAVVTFEGEEFPPPPFLEGPTAAELDQLRDALPPREVRRTFALGLEQPMTMQTTLGYQVAFAERWALSLDAIWTRTRHLPRSWDLNAIERDLTPQDTIDRDPGFGDPFRPMDPAETGFRRLTTTESGGNAEYLGLYTTLRHRATEHLTFEGNWVWSRSRNDTEDINFQAAHANDFEAEWADAVNDRRHQVSLRGVYEPREWMRVGWIADYQTGTPLNRVARFRDLDGSGSIFGNGFVGNHDRFPGVPRNGERLPGAFTMHLSAELAAPLGEDRLQVRVEVFNLFNSTNVSGFANGIPGGGPRTQVGRPGDPTSFGRAAPPRQFQLSASWGR